MNIKGFVTSPKGSKLADLGNGKYIAQANTFELAVCTKVPEGYKVEKLVVGGMMMRNYEDFVSCVEMLKESDI